MNPLFAQQEPGHIIEVITTDGQPENLFVSVGGTPVATTTALTGLSAPIGTLVYVTSQLRAYLSVPVGQGDVTGSATNDWKSLPETSSPTWRSQGIYFVSSLTGNDNNSGALIGQPIATVSELAQRLNGQFDVNMSIIFIDNNAGGTLTLIRKTPTINLSFFGNPTTATTDAVATYAVPNTATNVWAQLTGAVIADWGPFVGAWVHFTSGAAVGAVTPVVLRSPQAAGNNVAEIDLPLPQPTVANNWQPPDVTPAPGDTFRVETYPHLSELVVQVSDAGGNLSTGAFAVTIVPSIVVINLNVDRLATVSNGSGTLQNILWGCNVSDWSNGSGSIYQSTAFTCDFPLLQPNIPGAFYQYCDFRSTAGHIQEVTISRLMALTKCLFEGMFTVVNLEVAPAFFGCGFFNSPNAGLFLADGSSAVVTSSLLGQGNTTFGVVVAKSAILTFNNATVLKLTGTSGDWQMSTITYLWADAPRRDAWHSGTNTLGAGATVTVTEKGLPADALIQASIQTPAGAGSPGVLSIPSASRVAGAGGQFVVNSNVATDTSTFDWFWSSPTGGIGGVIRGN